MTRPPSHAVVTLPALDLRPRPDHRSELASQLLMGEVVRLESARPHRGWWKVRGEHDGYGGWARDWGLAPVSAARAGRWRRASRLRVSVPFAEALARPGGGIGVSPLFLGARLIEGRRRGSAVEVELPDGRRAWVLARAVRREAEPPESVAARVASLLGVPYLWGGRTPAGLDCSAFAQLVLAERGIRLPRDARDQHAACRPLQAGEAPREGDLAFFAASRTAVGHVGVSLGGGYFAHSRGWVRIAHTSPDNVLCDKELLPQFRGWFRPRPTRSRGPGRG